MILKTYKYRIYPNGNQRNMINKTIGVCRFIYNLALETKNYAYKAHGKNISDYDLCYQLTDLKKDYPWMAEVDSQAIQSAVKRVGVAFKNFFCGNGYPKFKRKCNGGSFQCPNNIRRIDWGNGLLTISKIKSIPITLSRRFNGKIKTVTISKTATGKYFASILVETKIEKQTLQKVAPETTIGIDVGIKSFVVTSDGKIFKPNRSLKESLKRLQCLQRRVSRKKKGSSNYKKSTKCVAILHEKITNQRTDYINKVTTQLTNDNQVGSIVIEDLNVAGMLKNRKLSQALSDVSFGEFFRQMKYKCGWYGKNLIVIGRFEPSSKICSDCGTIKEALLLSDRDWSCTTCGSLHDRDFNAAKNIRNIGLKKYSPEGIRVEPVELRRLRRTKKQESCV